LNNAGDTVSLQISCTDSAGETLAYSGTLPPGLTISASGQISGAPTTAGTVPSSVTATDTSGHSGHATFTWTIGQIALTCSDQVNNVGDAVSLQITATDPANEGLTYSGTLPPGLTINASGQISGAPTTAGTFPSSVTATDSLGGTGSCSFTWTVN
jgi:hypothetical protein